MSDSEASDIGLQVQAIAAKILDVPADTLAPQSCQDNTPGWKSLEHMNLIMAVEEAFSIRMTTREILSMRTLLDFENTVRARPASD